MDWTIPLKSQQQDFYHRLRLGNLLLCEQENIYSEIITIKAEKLESIIAECREQTTKYEKIYPSAQFFSSIFNQKLAETAFLSRFNDLVSLRDDLAVNNHENYSTFQLKSSPHLLCEIRAINYKNDNLIWLFSIDEIRQNHILICLLVQQEFDSKLAEYKVILAGFLPTNFIKNTEEKTQELSISNLLYCSGLKSYLIDLIKLKSNYITIARACERKGNYYGAITNYTQAINENQQEAKLYLQRGINHYKVGDIQGALLDLTEAITYNFNYSLAYHWRGFIYYQLGKYPEALKDYNEEIKINPLNFFAYYQRALIETKLSNYLAGLEDYSTAITINSNFFQAFYNRGNVNYKLGDKQGAIDDYEKALKLNPNLAQACYNLGVINSELGNYNQAITYYQEAIKIDPLYVRVHYNLAILLADLGGYQQAIDIYKSIKEINPNFYQADYNRKALISLLKKEGNIFLNHNQDNSAYTKKKHHIIGINQDEDIDLKKNKRPYRSLNTDPWIRDNQH